MSWYTASVITKELGLELWAVENTLALLDEECTVPFIARYRKELTNNMEPETLRQLQKLYESLKHVKSKILSIMEALKKSGKLTPKLEEAFMNVQCASELEQMYAPFKPGNKRSLAERARELGLEPNALKILDGKYVAMESLIQKGKEGIDNLKGVETGLKNIIADILAKDKETLDIVRNLCTKHFVTIESCRKVTKKKKNEEEKAKKDTSYKYEQYFEFSVSVRNAKSHQILAINRGENQKILSVKINIPDSVKQSFVRFCSNKWRAGLAKHGKLLNECIEDAYNRLVQPLMARQIRSNLTKSAEKDSVDVFASNLKKLLLTPPITGKVVLGIDPGFRNGCKVAVTSPTGKVLDTGVLYFLSSKSGNMETNKLRNMVMQHRCDTFAIGNGTACRETEEYLAGLIKQGCFRPLNVMYCIVSESGASIYSASVEAEKDLPLMDVCLRGAVSIARRLQDPLSELVKIEPKHIGVGMYQHDISENLLKSSLDGVVEDCVSFVGVDVNFATESLLRRVAGLNASKAKKIITWREENGNFINRQQLKSVKGLGPKSFEQCAGFVKIVTSSDTCIVKTEPDEPNTSTGKRKAASQTGNKKKKKKTESFEVNPLDMTIIHPESYETATRFLQMIKVNLQDIGLPATVLRVKNFARDNPLEGVATQLGVNVSTVKLIVEALQQPTGTDIRAEYEKPVFRKDVKSVEDLKIGAKVTGRVSNTTHFGAFVDIGVGRDGLIHCSKINQYKLGKKSKLELGDRVEVTILSIDQQRGRIGLDLVSV